LREPKLVIFDYGSFCMAGKERIADAPEKPERAIIASQPTGRVSQSGTNGEGAGGIVGRDKRARWGTGVRLGVLVVGVVAAATALRETLDPIFGEAKQFITFYPAIAVAALVGGARAGVMATVLSALSVDLLFIQPRGSLLAVRLSDGVALVLFATAGGLISWMAERVDRARRQEAEALERKRTEAWLRADVAALTRMHELSGKVLGAGGLEGLLREVVDAAVAIVGAEQGKLQLLEGKSLHIVAQHGHLAPFLKFFESAETRASASGEATKRRARVVVPDVEKSELFAGTESLAVLREAGVRAVQSTPVVSRGGQLLGILTTHWRKVYCPDEHDLWRIDLLVRQAADLIEEARAERALQESEARFRVMADGTPLSIWITDAEGRNRFVNRAYCEYFGVKTDEAHCFQPVVHPEDRAGYDEAFGAALRERKAFRAQARVRRHDNAWRWVDSYGEPRFSARGEFLGLAGSSPDVTERKEFQAELERLVAERTARLQEMVSELEHFSYTITHDLKAPLRAMRGFAEIASMVAGDSVSKEAKDALGRITTSAERMDALITDALDYSRSVRQELPLTDVDTGGLLRGMLDSYPELQPSKAHVQVEGKLPVVLGNQAGLTQCFSNLLGNAVKFVRPGEKPEIRVWAEEREGWARIWVEDKGIGISKEMLPRVFDMFSRGSKGYEGTGVGLALVRKVTQRMGGRAGVESEEGKGSRFWLQVKSVEARPRAARAESMAAEPKGGTVLYVEDEETDAMFMKIAFASRGMESALRVVNDGRAVIEYLSGAGEYGDRNKYPLPSVVLLDLNLPQVPGFEVLKWMRNHPDFARTPVVVFSSSTREDDRAKALELGANEFLGKPSSGMKFGEVVEALKERWLEQVQSA
jgi:PAS domain S-box-containing protein